MTYSIQDPTFCPTLPDDNLPFVQALLPQGPAWDAAYIPGTIQYGFWRAISTVVGWANLRLCAYENELFCATASESVDQWYSEYAVNQNDDCDPYGWNLCYKTTALGGQSCSYFVNLALLNGWVITCSDQSAMQDTLTISGCMQAGCSQIGPKSERSSPLSCIGDCKYGPVSAHPSPSYFEFGSNRSLLKCEIPGSTLGTDTDGCCMMAGYFDLSTPAITTSTAGGVCAPGSTVFTYAVPERSTIRPSVCLDSTGNFLAYAGYAHQWSIVIDVGLSTNLKSKSAAFAAQNWSMGNNIIAGCTYLDGLKLNPILCFLETVKPAHTHITYSLTNN